MSEPNSFQKRIDELENQSRQQQQAIAAEREKNEVLSQKLKVLEPENEVNALEILSRIAEEPRGLTLDELTEKTKLHRERVRFVLQVAQKVGHIQAHGGGDELLYYKLQDGGRVFLMSKGVI